MTFASIPKEYAVRAMPFITALRPPQSPPLVMMPIFLILSMVSSSLKHYSRQIRDFLFYNHWFNSLFYYINSISNLEFLKQQSKFRFQFFHDGFLHLYGYIPPL